MLRTDSMSTRLAQVMNRVAACGGRVNEEQLDTILREFGITRQKQDYKTKMVEYSYLDHDTHSGYYHVSEHSRKVATIEITVKPSLYAEEVRRHLVETLAAYGGIIGVGEVEI